MPLCEWDTSTIHALADAFLSSPRYVNRNTRRGYTGNPGHWRLATDSDSSPVAQHAISAWRGSASKAVRGGWIQNRTFCARPGQWMALAGSAVRDVARVPCRYLAELACFDDRDRTSAPERFARRAAWGHRVKACVRE